MVSQNSPPSIPWRVLANTIVKLDGDSLPVVIAKGVPEVFPLRSDMIEKEMSKEGVKFENILFGTACWLYNYGGKWRLGTKRKVDAGGVTLRTKSSTLWESFSSAVSISLDKLNPKLCYGFILHDRSQHIFSYEGVEKRLWHVSTFEEMERKSVNIGVPSPDSVSDSAEKLVAKCVKGDTLGFIIRHGVQGKDSPERESLDYIVKSPLYSFIERQIGKTVPLREIMAKDIYLVGEDRKLFYKTFPHLVKYSKEADKALETLAGYLSRYHAGLKSGSKMYDTPEIAHLHSLLKIDEMKVISVETVKKLLLDSTVRALGTRGKIKKMIVSLLPVEMDEVKRSYTV
jgi:hypothetical protein